MGKEIQTPRTFSVLSPGQSALPVSLRPYQCLLSLGEEDRITSSTLRMSKWRLREAKQVLQRYTIKTKETKPGFDPRSVLCGGLCF